MLDSTSNEHIAGHTGRPRATETTPPLTIVSYDYESLKNRDKIQAQRIPDSFLRPVLFMGMIANMPGQCLVIDRDGKGHWGCHPDMFFVLTEEET